MRGQPTRRKRQKERDGGGKTKDRVEGSFDGRRFRNRTRDESPLFYYELSKTYALTKLTPSVKVSLNSSQETVYEPFIIIFDKS